MPSGSGKSDGPSAGSVEGCTPRHGCFGSGERPHPLIPFGASNPGDGLGAGRHGGTQPQRKLVRGPPKNLR